MTILSDVAHVDGRGRRRAETSMTCGSSFSSKAMDLKLGLKVRLVEEVDVDEGFFTPI